MDSSILGARGRLRYDTRCYFNVRSKAGISQLNLYTARNQKLKSGKRRSTRTPPIPRSRGVTQQRCGLLPDHSLDLFSLSCTVLSAFYDHLDAIVARAGDLFGVSLVRIASGDANGQSDVAAWSAFCLAVMYVNRERRVAGRPARGCRGHRGHTGQPTRLGW